MQLFYHPEVAPSMASIVLDRIESQHCVKVLRHKTGDKITIINGKGKKFSGCIEEANARACVIGQVTLLDESQRDSFLTIAIAPTKNADRYEWFVEKATEIGVQKIVPLQCERSERHRIKLDRLYKKAISAIKQNQSLWLPQIEPLMSFEDFLKSDNADTKLIAHLGADTKKISSQELIQPVSILVGPEGDFSAEEIRMADEYGYKAISLGTNVLRTETAGVVACALCA